MSYNAIKYLGVLSRISTNLDNRINQGQGTSDLLRLKEICSIYTGSVNETMQLNPSKVSNEAWEKLKENIEILQFVVADLDNKEN